jgi:hypothetical protein
MQEQPNMPQQLIFSYYVPLLLIVGISTVSQRVGMNQARIIVRSATADNAP